MVSEGGSANHLFVRGDANSDGIIDVSDGNFLQQFLFSGGPAPECFDAADVNDDGMLDAGDPAYLYDFLFTSSSPPPAPYPDSGTDPTPDAWVCE